MFLANDIIKEIRRSCNDRPSEYFVTSVRRNEIEEGRYSIEIDLVKFDQTDKKTLILKVTA